MKKIILLISLICFASIFTGCMDGDSTGVEEVTFSESMAYLEVGDTYNLSSITNVYPSGVNYDAVKWISYHESIATISSSGILTAVSGGSTSVSLSVDGNIATMDITVIEEGDVVEMDIYTSNDGLVTGGITIWEGNSEIETDLEDGDYANTIKIIENGATSSWSNIVFNGLNTSIPEIFDEVKFKVKGEESGQIVQVYIMGQTYDVTLSGTDWNEVTVSFDDLSGTNNADGQLGFICNREGGVFYITDVVFATTDNTSTESDSDSSEDATFTGTLFSADGGLSEGIDISIWENNSTIDVNNGDGDYTQVIKVTENGSGWSNVVLTGFDSTITTDYDQIKFKGKSSNGSIKLHLVGKEKVISLSSETSLGNDWYEVTVPFSDLSGDYGTDIQIAFIGEGAGVEFSITDIVLESN